VRLSPRRGRSGRRFSRQRDGGENTHI